MKADDSLCAVGTSAFNYSIAMYTNQWGYRPNATEVRAKGLEALFQAGPLSKETLQILAGQNRGRRAPKTRPHIVELTWTHEYRAMPFASRSFDLLLSQRSMKFSVDGWLDFAPVGDELIRTLGTPGFAVLQLITSDGNALKQRGFRWLTSAMIGQRTEPLMFDPPKSGAGKQPGAKPSNAELQWLAKRMASKDGRVLPLEGVLGEVREQGTSNVCETPSCRICRAKRHPARDGRVESASGRRCTFAWLSGTDKKLNLILYVFEPAERAGDSSCSLATRAQPSWLRNVLLEYGLRPEAEDARARITAALERRSMAINASRALASRRPKTKREAMHEATVQQLLYVESIVTGIRRWFRTWDRLHHFAPTQR